MRGRLSCDSINRAERWIVMSGTARVTIGKGAKLLSSTKISRFTSQAEPLELIEIQSGSYLGEGETVPIEDDYNRG
jgi:mannose-1-phosphate guanylyltransferase / mannose-6-phosphate isomerase